MSKLICTFKVKVKQFWSRVKNFTLRVSPKRRHYHISVHADKVYEVNSCDEEFCVKVRQAIEPEDEQKETSDE